MMMFFGGMNGSALRVPGVAARRSSSRCSRCSPWLFRNPSSGTNSASALTSSRWTLLFSSPRSSGISASPARPGSDTGRRGRAEAGHQSALPPGRFGIWLVRALHEPAGKRVARSRARRVFPGFARGHRVHVAGLRARSAHPLATPGTPRHPRRPYARCVHGPPRQAQGGQFISQTLWSAWPAWAISLGLAAALGVGRLSATPRPEHASPDNRGVYQA